MAQPDLQRFDSRGLLVATAGVTLLANTHGVRLIDGSSGREFDKVERNLDSAVLGSKPFGRKNKRAFIQGGKELWPPTVPGHATNGVVNGAPALLACAIAQTLDAIYRTSTYSPVSSGMAMADASWYHSTTLLAVTDARGNISGLKMEIGERFSINQLRLQGDYEEISEAALPDITLSEVVPTVSTYDNSELVITEVNGVDVEIHLRAKRLSVDLGNTVTTKEYTEHKETGIGEAAGTFSMLFALPDLSEFNPQQIADDCHIVRGYYILREEDGRYSKLAVRCQFENVNDTDTDKDFTYEVTGPVIPGGLSDPAWFVEFGDETFRVYFNFTQPKVEDVVAVYTQPVLVGEYTAPITWSISVGALPAGLSINAATGAITGTPTTVGTTAFTIQAVDSSTVPQTATIAGSLEITA